jgi:hypothetical protein
MRTYSLLLGSLLPILLLFACTNDKTANKANIQFINIDVKSADSTQFGDIFSSVKIIPLHSDSQAIIKEITKLYMTDSFIIIPDIRQSSVYIFGRDGSFKTKIQELGPGPKQYMYMNDVLFDEESQMIKVWNFSDYSFVNFNCEGKYVSSGKIPNRKKAGYNLASNSGYYYFDRWNKNLDGYHLGIFSKAKNEFVQSVVKIQPALLGKSLISLNNLDGNNDLMYYAPFLTDTIYVLEKDKMKDKFVVNIDGGQFFPEKAKLEYLKVHNLFEVAAKNNYIPNFEQLFAFDNGFFFSFFGPKRCNVFYNNRQKKTICFRDKLKTPDNKDIRIDFIASKYKNGLIGVSLVRNTRIASGKLIKDSTAKPQNPSILLLELAPE